MVTDNNILFSYQVITEYNYVNADFKTTNSEEIFVCYNLTDNQIIDCYTPSNYYDISIRGEISQTSIKNNKFTTSNEIKARKNNLITDINNTFEHETTNTDSKKSPAKAVKSINNTAVVNYARANYNKASPARGKSTVLIMIFLQFQAAMTVLILFLMHYLQAEQTLMIPEEMELAVADGISEV